MAKQKSKASFWAILILLVLLLLARGFKSCNTLIFHNEPDPQIRDRTKTGNHKSEWRFRKLVYTKHARCRMECRHISKSEVVEIQQNGTINYSKSDLNDKPCPSYAVEGITNDGQQVRIVFGACQKITTVITCIDIHVEHACQCN